MSCLKCHVVHDDVGRDPNWFFSLWVILKINSSPTKVVLWRERLGEGRLGVRRGVVFVTQNSRRSVSGGGRSTVTRKSRSRNPPSYPSVEPSVVGINVHPLVFKISLVEFEFQCVVQMRTTSVQILVPDLRRRVFVYPWSPHPRPETRSGSRDERVKRIQTRGF